MPTLHEFQRRFRAALTAASGDDLADIVQGEGAVARLAVYRNNVLGTLSAALGLNFPATACLVGADFFAAAAARFIVASPPRSADLHEYGEAFPAFLATQPGITARPYIAAVAALEWAVAQALHAPLAPALGAARLAALAPEAQAALRFRAHPSLRLMTTSGPARAIWEAVLQPDEALRARNLAAIDLAAPGETLAVLRVGGTIALHPLAPAAFAFAQALADGETLAEALARVPPQSAAAWLGAFLAQGFFCDGESTTPDLITSDAVEPDDTGSDDGGCHA